VAVADFVFAGNRYLADHAIRCGAGGKIEVIPTCVDPSRYQLADHHDQQPTRLVWIGSKGTLPALEDARDVLEEIGKALPNTVLRIICDRFPRFRHLRIEKARWSEATEQSDLRSADIGISWIPDDAYSRGKCGLKVLQYMAAGLPVVASPVGVHHELLPSAAGFLPENKDDWLRHVSRLVADSSLREEMGRHGRERLERGFHIDTWGPELADKLKQVAARL
jgi:glycosyltransferase involved in cell wall biosynthesis